MTIAGLNHIDGRWVPAASGAVFERRNPADESDLVVDHQDLAVVAAVAAQVPEPQAVVHALDQQRPLPLLGRRQRAAAPRSTTASTPLFGR